MRKSVRALLASACVAAAMPAGAAELRYNTFEPPRTIAAQEVTAFFKQLSARTNGALSGRVFTGGQLLNGPATLKGIGDGVVDGGLIIPSFNQGELRNTNVVIDMLPYMTNGLVAGPAAVETLVVDCAECHEDFKAANVVWLGGHAPTPWNMMCKDVVGRLEDLRGKRIRIAGTSATRMVQALGGVAVQLNTAEIAPALQGGQIDCAVGPAAWLSDLGMMPSIRTVIDYAFGVYAAVGIYTFNRNSYAKIAPEHKNVMLDLIAENVIRGHFVYREKDKSERQKATAQGITFWKPGAEFEQVMEDFRKAEMPRLVDAMKRRGVADPDKLIRIHLDNYKKWEAKVAAVNEDPDKLIAEVRREVYAKSPY